jgi:glycyl-tRNA synthetase
VIFCTDSQVLILVVKVLSLPPAIAPVKVSVLPLLQNESLNAFIPQIIKWILRRSVRLIVPINHFHTVTLLTNNGISCKLDDTGQSIGRRYARTDEIGIPFGITIDFDTVSDNSVTLRERDSTAQVRVKV